MIGNLISRIAYAIVVGILAFLVAFGLGEAIIHFVNLGDFGQRITGLSVVIGFLIGLYVFFRYPQTPVI